MLARRLAFDGAGSRVASCPICPARSFRRAQAGEQVDDAGDGYPELIRLIGYVPTSALFLILGVLNAVLVLTCVSLFHL